MRDKILKRENIVNDAIKYFNSGTWKKAVDLFRDPEVKHIHVFVDSNLRLESIASMAVGYLKKQGWGVVREFIDIFAHSSNPNGPGVIHTVYPTPTPGDSHMDIFVNYMRGTTLATAPPERGERGYDVLVWRTKNVTDIVDKYSWCTVGSKEEEELKKYFKSEQWKITLEQIERPEWVHFHNNIETSIDRLELEKYVLKELEEKGWKVHHTVHVVFNPPREMPKIVFIMTKPHKIWDIMYSYNPNTVIKPLTAHIGYEWQRDENPWHDIHTTKMYERWLYGKEFIALSEGEIQAILAGC